MRGARRGKGPCRDTADSHQISGEIAIAEGGLSLLDSAVNITVVAAKGLVQGYHPAPVELTRSGDLQFFVMVPKRVQGQLIFSSVTVQVESAQVELKVNVGVDFANVRLIFDGSRIQFLSRAMSSQITVKIQKASIAGSIQVGSADDVCSDPQASLDEATGLVMISFLAGARLATTLTSEQSIAGRSDLQLPPADLQQGGSAGLRVVWAVDPEKLGEGAWEGVFRANSLNSNSCELSARIVVEAEAAAGGGGGGGGEPSNQAPTDPTKGEFWSTVEKAGTQTHLYTGLCETGPDEYLHWNYDRLHGILKHEVPLYRICQHLYIPGKGTMKNCSKPTDPYFKIDDEVLIPGLSGLVANAHSSTGSSGNLAALFILSHAMNSPPMLNESLVSSPVILWNDNWASFYVKGGLDMHGKRPDKSCIVTRTAWEHPEVGEPQYQDVIRSVGQVLLSSVGQTIYLGEDLVGRKLDIRCVDCEPESMDDVY